MRARPTLLLAALLVVPSLVVLAPPAAARTTRTLTITTGSAHPAHSFQAFDGDPVKLFDFDGDGVQEIIAQNDNRYVAVFDSTNGALRAELTTTYPGGWGARSINGPEASVMLAGHKTHLIVANSAAFLTDFVFDGVRNGTFTFTKVWERRLGNCHDQPGMDSKPVLADLDKDGDFEILAQTEEVGVYALDRLGYVVWKQCIGGGNGEPGVGDLDNDGWPDAVFCGDGGVCSALDGRTGRYKWSFDVRRHGLDLGSGSMPVGPAVTQLDGRGGADVVVGVRDSHDCQNYTRNHAALFAIAGNGSLLWARRPASAAPLTYTHAIVSDVDGNGQKDVLWSDWNTQGHACGDWEVVGQSHVFRYDAAGTLRWTATTAAFWNDKDLALADIDADGVQEVLATCTSGGHEGVCYLNSRNGTREAFVDAWPWKVTRGPVVEDLWARNTTQWVLPVYAYGNGTSGGALQVYDTGVPFDAAWPHLPYPRL
jgi:hypothetical protein